MIYKSSFNHKVDRVTFKDFFGCLVIVFQVFSGFSFSPFNPLLWRVTSDSFLNLFQPLNFLCAQIVVATIPLWA